MFIVTEYAALIVKLHEKRFIKAGQTGLMSRLINSPIAA